MGRRGSASGGENFLLLLCQALPAVLLDSKKSRKAQVHAPNTGTFPLDLSFYISSDVMILKTCKFSSPGEISVDVM